MYWPFKTSTHSQSEIFSLKAVIVACSLCSYTVAFQDQHTLPKRNILSHSCYCGLLCVFAFQDQHTLPKRNILSHSCYCGLLCVFVKYSLSQLLLWLALCFRTSTPSQREIFSQSCYCGLLVWSCLSVPTHPPKVKYSTSTFT